MIPWWPVVYLTLFLRIRRQDTLNAVLHALYSCRIIRFILMLIPSVRGQGTAMMMTVTTEIEMTDMTGTETEVSVCCTHTRACVATVVNDET